MRQHLAARSLYRQEIERAINSLKFGRTLKRHIDEVKAEEEARDLATDELERIRKDVKRRP